MRGALERTGAAIGVGMGVMMASSRPVAMADRASGTSGTRHQAPGTGHRAKGKGSLITYLFDYGENPGLRIVVAVSANSLFAQR